MLKNKISQNTKLKALLAPFFMPYSTKYRAAPHDRVRINHKDLILSIGSCFSTNISQRLKNLKFRVINNPYGTLYNPHSILESLFLQEEAFSGNYVQRDELWVNYLSHSDINSTSKPELESLLYSKAEELSQLIKNCNYLVLTFGSSKIYRLKNTGQIVANCHKVPQQEFKSELYKSQELVEHFKSSHSRLKEFNPDLKIILTVSPVRYLGDGMQFNQLNKSHLILACNEIVDQLEDVYYFPSYEIILDDLRDYRWYEPDLIHPNKQAIEYVWSIFTETYFSEQTKSTNQEIEQISRNIEHRAFNPNSSAYKKHLNKTIDLINKHNELDFTEELRILKDRIT